jgi:hypothetical protein
MVGCFACLITVNNGRFAQNLFSISYCDDGQSQYGQSPGPISAMARLWRTALFRVLPALFIVPYRPSSSNVQTLSGAHPPAHLSLVGSFQQISYRPNEVCSNADGDNKSIGLGLDSGTRIKHSSATRKATEVTLGHVLANVDGRNEMTQLFPRR